MAGLWRLTALIGLAEAHVHDRRCERHQRQRARQGRGHRVAGHAASPAGRQAGVGSRAPAAHEGHPQPVDPAAEQAQQRGQQCEGGHDAHGNNHRGGKAEQPDRPDARDQQTGDGDHDRRAREQNRRSGGGGRLGGSVDDAPAVTAGFTEAGDDEQRVVDADTQSDHRRQRRRPGGDVGRRREDGDEGLAHHRREQGHADRQQHRDDRTECEEQHDDSDEQADLLLDLETISTDHLPPEFGLPPEITAEAVPTSVAIGKDGAIYVGELKGFPFRPGPPTSGVSTRMPTERPAR